ncbi:hypothetical protein BU52_07885 [Streptomyces toyocaensis]|uniref:Uncharacterized protein n=1 Tax=Streptomyces toyocaensis TaxID=55952 RepID=A0A081XWB0_STRTO|nr:hypothetical protein BU52_07885 [Streptomyces toyocaensis]
MAFRATQQRRAVQAQHDAGTRGRREELRRAAEFGPVQGELPRARGAELAFRSGRDHLAQSEEMHGTYGIRK